MPTPPCCRYDAAAYADDADSARVRDMRRRTMLITTPSIRHVTRLRRRRYQLFQDDVTFIVADNIRHRTFADVDTRA